jgi:predicted O-methyltransferase YrrM
MPFLSKLRRRVTALAADLGRRNPTEFVSKVPGFSFTLEWPRPGTVHPVGFPMLIAGWCVGTERLVRRIELVANGVPVWVQAMNNPREEVLQRFPQARAAGVNAGFNHYTNLPASVQPGPLTLEFFAHTDAGWVRVAAPVIQLAADGGNVPNLIPDGAYYSPVIDPFELKKDYDRVWPKEPEILAIDFNREGQRCFLAEEFPRHLADFKYPQSLLPGAREYEFRLNNATFCPLDAAALFVMLRKFRPRNMIEIGSGFSSLLTADVNRRFLAGQLNFTCIEPYPRPFLVEGVPGIAQLVQKRVQEVPLSAYDALGAGDFLFIDSSHVAKTGSDVNHLYFDVIPRLRPGVIIHVHDVHLPNDYMAERVLAVRQSWTEQYVLRAMLMFSDWFEVIFGSAYVQHYFPDLVRAVLGDDPGIGASFWFHKKR